MNANGPPLPPNPVPGHDRIVGDGAISPPKPLRPEPAAPWEEPAAGGATTTLAEAVTTNFLGGANLRETMSPPTKSGSTVVLTWSAVEGDEYHTAFYARVPKFCFYRPRTAILATGLPASIRPQTNPHDRTGLRYRRALSARAIDVRQDLLALPALRQTSSSSGVGGASSMLRGSAFLFPPSSTRRTGWYSCPHSRQKCTG